MKIERERGNGEVRYGKRMNDITKSRSSKVHVVLSSFEEGMWWHREHLASATKSTVARS